MLKECLARRLFGVTLFAVSALAAIFVARSFSPFTPWLICLSGIGLGIVLVSPSEDYADGQLDQLARRICENTYRGHTVWSPGEYEAAKRELD